MKRFGPKIDNMKKMDGNDIFLERVNLLVVIVKAVLKGYPIGNFRKKAAMENATLLHKLVYKTDLSFIGPNNSSHLFQERVKFLCVMAAAMLTDKQPLGIRRREAILENIEGIHEFAFSTKELQTFYNVLKVA